MVFMIFISYSRKDEYLVHPLVHLLRASGQSVFIDVENIDYGYDWQSALGKAIKESDRFLLFWSKASLGSEYVRCEFETAIKTPSCKIVPVLLDNTPLPAVLSRFQGVGDLDFLMNAIAKQKILHRLSQFMRPILIFIPIPLLIILIKLFAKKTAEGFQAAAHSIDKSVTQSAVDPYPVQAQSDFSIIPFLFVLLLLFFGIWLFSKRYIKRLYSKASDEILKFKVATVSRPRKKRSIKKRK
jgi:hypothetical protein